jgi:phosphotransferase system HPr (HPr) family protein
VEAERLDVEPRAHRDHHGQVAQVHSAFDRQGPHSSPVPARDPGATGVYHASLRCLVPVFHDLSAGAAGGRLPRTGGETIPQRSLTINHVVGLHARPAALFAETAGRFSATTIEVVKDGEARDAKSILGLLTLGVTQGTTVVLRAEGPEAGEALAALTDLVERNFSE